ncbi:hypothetical protein PIB30_018410 [Stylosanthes scabra]|uniref:PB1-like domain-containing protein n=1 Tax=Stylosanthes scabra TaxID=79078 RepID=A0ABU6T7M4_9FABA|nr:hypothetical protein [Stylosanthes scabra]
MKYVRRLGDDDVAAMWYKDPSIEDMSIGLKMFLDDKYALAMVRIARQRGYVQLYVVHDADPEERFPEIGYIDVGGPVGEDHAAFQDGPNEEAGAEADPPNGQHEGNVQNEDNVQNDQVIGDPPNGQHEGNVQNEGNVQAEADPPNVQNEGNVQAEADPPNGQHEGNVQMRKLGLRQILPHNGHNPRNASQDSLSSPILSERLSLRDGMIGLSSACWRCSDLPSTHVSFQKPLPAILGCLFNVLRSSNRFGDLG